MQIVVLTGPINAGKTTTGRALAKLVADASFVDGDDHDAPDDAPLAVRISASMAHIESHIIAAQGVALFVAVPLRDEDYRRLRDTAHKVGAELRVVTLNPPSDVAFTDRGGRQLSPDEIARAQEMYAEGYASRAFSTLVVTDMPGPEATARAIARDLQLTLRA